jgi:hypothetical protein
MIQPEPPVEEGESFIVKTNIFPKFFSVTVFTTIELLQFVRRRGKWRERHLSMLTAVTKAEITSRSHFIFPMQHVTM